MADDGEEDAQGSASAAKPNVPRLTLNTSNDKFELWSLRFEAHCAQHHPTTVPLFEYVMGGKFGEDGSRPFPTDNEISEFIATKPKVHATAARTFSSLIINSVGDDVLAAYRRTFDLRAQGLNLYVVLRQHYAAKQDAELSPDEQVLKSLRQRLQVFETNAMESFLRDMLIALQVARRSGPNPTAERYLLLHVIQQLNAADKAWIPNVVAPFMTYVRSEGVRTRPNDPVPPESSLTTLADKVRAQLSVNTPVGGAQCTNCGRTGHKASKCFDRDRSKPSAPSVAAVGHGGKKVGYSIMDPVMPSAWAVPGLTE